MSQIKKIHYIKTSCDIKQKSPFEKFEYSNALFDIKYIFIDKVFSEVLKINDADKELFINDDHIIEETGVGYA
tara:strand:+ start:372 stop:590 length:219 start_codon:yes stop_codon:yes gene_type:complete